MVLCPGMANVMIDSMAINVCIPCCSKTICSELIMDKNKQKQTRLTVASWNMQCKMRSGKTYAKELCNSADFLAISEHGLYECEMQKLENIHRDFMGFGKADRHLDNKNHGKVKGYNGCGIIWRSSINNRVNRLPELGSDRICVIKVKLTRYVGVYIIAIYLPHQSCKIAKFEDEVLELEKFIVECIKDGKILIIGDGNVSFSSEYGPRGGSVTSRNAMCLINMLSKYNIY